MSEIQKKYIVRKKILYPELSFIINGAIFEVFRQIGGGHLEKYYQKAVALELKNCGINFKEQVHTPLRFNNETVGTYYLDFLIEDTIILELKRGRFLPAAIINQTKQYLSAHNLELALIACFTEQGALVKRIVNTKESSPV